MEQLKKLKRQSVAGLLVLILLLCGIGILGIAASNLFASEPEAVNLYDVPRDQLEGSYVTVELEWIYGCYAYTETYENGRPTGIITEQEYIIDANDQDYMCMILDKDWFAQADALLAECDAYYYGEADEITKSFTVTGKVKRLPADSVDLYHEYVEYESMSSEEQSLFLPLYLEPADYSIQFVPLIFGCLFLIGALAILYIALSGRYQKQIKAKLEQMFGDNTERADEFLRQLMDTPHINKLHISGGYVLLHQGCCQMLLDNNDLVWAYKQTVRNKLYGIIPIGKTYSLVLKTVDKKEFTVVMDESKVKEQLINIAQQFPSCAIGYSDQLVAMYRNDPASLRQVAAAQRENVQM